MGKAITYPQRLQHLEANLTQALKNLNRAIGEAPVIEDEEALTQAYDFLHLTILKVRRLRARATFLPKETTTC